MKKTVIYCLVLLFIGFFLTDCKKDTSNLQTATIKGSVFNLCTNKNLAGIVVYFETKGPKGNSSVAVTSDPNGNFAFSDVSINMSSDYNYVLIIESKSGIGNGPEVGFDGVNIGINKSDLGHIFTLGVVPHFKTWNLYFPAGTTTTINDTFSLTLQQKIFHANVPGNSNYKLTICDSPTFPPPTTNSIGAVSNYWMGWWYSTLDKTMNGVHTIKIDSFYVDWVVTKTDTIQF
jgi:hypothetical protein